MTDTPTVSPATGRDPLRVTEQAWQQQVIQLAETLGWRTMHVRRSVVRQGQWATATSVSGWPDLVLWHETQQRVLYAELKTDKGRVRRDQDLILMSLARAGAEALVWRPRDLAEVTRILQGARLPASRTNQAAGTTRGGS